MLRAPSRGVLRAWGLALAVASVILPALPMGPLLAQPPLPFAVLWAAYGWAAEDESGWRAPIALALLGLLHDQLAGGPYGLFMLIYLAASGEASGRLDMMLERAADYLEREFDAFTSTALALLEPAIIIVMGVIVALIVLSILLPILQRLIRTGVILDGREEQLQDPAFAIAGLP